MKTDPAGKPKAGGTHEGADVRRGDVHVLRNRCPYCHDDLELEEEAWIACAGCLARHHEGCWAEGGACGACGGGERLAPVQEAGVRLEEAAPPPPDSGMVLGLVLTTFVVALVATAAVYPSSLLVGLVGALFVGAPLFGASVWLADRRRARQKRAGELSQDALAGWPSYPVCFASDAFFNTGSKLNPWEATGVLTLGPTAVTLSGETPAWERFYSPKEASVEWVGQSLLRNGLPNWFCISQANERIYFTAEPGLALLPSHGTRVIYERIVRSGRDGGLASG